jgi:carbamoyltransferase
VIVVGISALFHDAACAILRDGQLVAAAQEERFTRRRNERAMPVNAFRACLQQAGLSITDVDRLAYYEDPAARLGRQLWTHQPAVPEMELAAMHRLGPDRPLREIREYLGYDGPVDVVTHHESHAASAFFCSGFREAALLTADAVGEWSTTAYGRGGPGGVELLEEVRFPHSLGLLYSTVTSYLGFAVNSDEYKVMGLAAYGGPRLRAACDELLQVLPGGQFRLDARYFDFASSDRMYTDNLTELVGFPPRAPGAEVTGQHADLAAGVQGLLEDVLLDKARHLQALTGCDRLAYAGGVALNCVANGRLRRDGPFREIFVQPAAGDAGAAVGAAALVHRRATGAAPVTPLVDAFLGPAYDDARLRRCLEVGDVPFSDFRDNPQGLLERTADLLAAGAVVGWFQGRMEFGPRALGGRSVLADPRDGAVRDRINALVKKREAFRPFAPAVVAERCAEFFDLAVPSPFMLDTAEVRSGHTLGAVTHVDGSARVQTVDAAVDPRFHGLLTAFGRRTGAPVLLNTSFNSAGEPIVADPASALAGFVRCGLDALVVGDLLIMQADVPRFWTEMITMVDPAPTTDVSGDVYSFV